MTNQDVLNNFLDIQEGTMFSKSIQLDFARIIHNDTDATPFWNYALVDKTLDEEEVATIEERLRALDRSPAICFENTDSFAPFINTLEKAGYQLNNDDSWMFYEGGAIDTARFESIKRVSSPEELALWSDTIDKCYRENDPQNPYGELGAYIGLAERAWETNQAEGAFEYLTAFKGDVPVAVATLTLQNGLGYISNVGSIQEVRGQGYGKLITLYCVDQAQRKGAKEVYLGTEEGTYPHDFYQKISFKTHFTARNYVMN